MDTSEIIKIANSIGLEKTLFMYCDSAEPDRIKMWKMQDIKLKELKKARKC
ncbi:putative terminase large subunit domain protein [Clostridioides difficile CD39]|nr:putative terminase large subunit domain protein [Clostridioides difficile CD39]